MRIWNSAPAFLALFLASSTHGAWAQGRPLADSTLVVHFIQESEPDSVGKFDYLLLVENIGADPVRLPAELHSWAVVEALQYGLIQSPALEYPIHQSWSADNTRVLGPGVVYGFHSVGWTGQEDSLRASVQFPLECEFSDVPTGTASSPWLRVRR